MKYEEYLDNLIAEDKKSMLTEHDMQLLASLQNMVEERPSGEVIAKPRNRKRIILSLTACFIVAVVAITLIVYYALNGPGNALYLKDNFVEVESDLSELNADLNFYNINVSEIENNVIVKRIYDSVSGDNIYYDLKIGGTQIEYGITVVVNKNYNYEDFKFDKEPYQSTLLNYSILYTQLVEPASDGTSSNVVNCKAEWQIENQCLYVTRYREYSDGEGTFFETLQSIVQFKK